MKRNSRDWLLQRDDDATPRLDALRRGALLPERASWTEILAEFFRPNLAWWASLTAIWLALLIVHLVVAPSTPALSQNRRGPELASVTIAYPDEAISPLDRRS